MPTRPSGDLASAVPCDSPTDSHTTDTNTHSVHTGNKARGLVRAQPLWLLLKVTLGYGAQKRWRKKKIIVLFTKCGDKEQNRMNLFSAVCCLLCFALLPSFPTIQILPFSLCHLSHTDVRMSMTQQGHCFVVLFYLFLDNEKSAEELAWCLLPHIFTHETLSRPYGLSTGGFLTLLTLWHQKHRSSTSEGCCESTLPCILVKKDQCLRRVLCHIPCNRF